MCNKCAALVRERMRKHVGCKKWKPGKRGRCPNTVKDTILSIVDWKMDDITIAIETGFDVRTITKNRPKYENRTTDT